MTWDGCLRPRSISIGRMVLLPTLSVRWRSWGSFISLIPRDDLNRLAAERG